MTYQFKIQINGIKRPTVWRRLCVPETISLHSFHEIIQMAFGWQNCHLYQFSSHGWGSDIIYKNIDPDYDNETVSDSALVNLSEIFVSEKQKLKYIYDFGDNWEHDIILEKVSEENIYYSECIDGKGACPPEDCGGVPGYLNLINILADPKHSHHKEMREWLGLHKGSQLNVDKFDIVAINNRLRHLGLS
ncbi:MAG: plasmid pRiA4b ORF-3 family protein [Sphingobacteriales bacterium]